MGFREIAWLVYSLQLYSRDYGCLRSRCHLLLHNAAMQIVSWSQQTVRLIVSWSQQTVRLIGSVGAKRGGRGTGGVSLFAYMESLHSLSEHSGLSLVWSETHTRFVPAAKILQSMQSDRRLWDPIWNMPACVVWDPYTHKNIKSLEQVQAFACKLALRRWDAGYEELLGYLTFQVFKKGESTSNIQAYPS